MKIYSLSNEPLVLMKYHLLINYDDFIFIYNEPSKNGISNNYNNNKRNRVTFINERQLFNGNNSEYFKGKDKALPISIELFNKKDSHSKQI